ncbi:porimin [Trichosurus vulpecula]|uniref:porimin n=1 Tax=Trichosurus vulpecula TaxID=9337 RepID=UPI00186ACECF|nr:porimin [Trichosurus vulpecula]
MNKEHAEENDEDEVSSENNQFSIALQRQNGSNFGLLTFCCTLHKHTPKWALVKTTFQRLPLPRSAPSRPTLGREQETSLEACLRWEAAEPAFTTPSIARRAPAAPRSAPPRVHLALLGSSRPSRPRQVLRLASLPAPFPARGLPAPIWSSGESTERARQPARRQRSAQKERKGPRCGLRSTPGERGPALAATSVQIPRRSLFPQAGRPASLGTMRLSAVATPAPVLVAALQVLLLLEAAHSVSPNTTQTNQTIPETPKVTTNNTDIESNLTSSTTKPVTLPPSTSASTSKTTETPHATTKISTPGPNSTVKPLATTRSTPQITTAHSASKSSAATASNSTMTTTATLATATANINAQISRGSKFDIGSFVGGIVLTLGVLSILYIGCKTYYSRGIRYRTIDEHDAII